MKKVIVSVSNNLVTDQRVAKVCNSLYENGFEVLLVGRNFPKVTGLNRKYKTKNLTLFFNKGALFYAEFNIRLFFFLFFTKKDVLLANDIDTLLSNYLVSKLQNKKIVFDSHELFSEIPELVDRPRIKDFWLGLEQKIIPKLKNCYTVCESIANHYQEKYNTKFEVVRNTPIKKELSVDAFEKTEKVIVYQGAVNVGRGLELMIETMKYLDGFLLWIIGDGGVFEELKQKVEREELTEKVLFFGRVLPDELYEITPKACLGISLEEDLGMNYRYALPNKIFDYIQAEVPILISDLPEMKNVVDHYKVGEIVEYRDPEFLTKQIKALVEKDFSGALKKAKQELIWEKEEQKLLRLFNDLK